MDTQYLKKQEQIKQSMERLKHETAVEMGVDQVHIPYNGGDMTSRSIGIHAGPVGGEMVKKMVASAKEELIKQYGVTQDQIR